MKKKIGLVVTICVLVCSLSACSLQKKSTALKPDVVQIKQICELATLECYYHNVAKSEKSGSGDFFWKKDNRTFWIDYTGIARIGIDMSEVTMEMEDDVVTVYVPEAKLLNIEVKDDTLSKNSYYISEDNSGLLSGGNLITAEDQTSAINKAQEEMEDTVKANKALLLNAKERSKTLIENYIVRLGEACGQKYTVVFKDLVDDNKEDESLQTEKEE